MKNSEQPAFPLTKEVWEVAKFQPNPSGLTKREYFAGLAMQALISKGDFINYNSTTAADYAITYADELLRVLEKQQQ